MNFDLNVTDAIFTLQLWSIVRNAYGDQPDLSELAETLSQNFESLYEKKVRNFQLPPSPPPCLYLSPDFCCYSVNIVV